VYHLPPDHLVCSTGTAWPKHAQSLRNDSPSRGLAHRKNCVHLRAPGHKIDGAFLISHHSPSSSPVSTPIPSSCSLSPQTLHIFSQSSVEPFCVFHLLYTSLDLVQLQPSSCIRLVLPQPSSVLWLLLLFVPVFCHIKHHVYYVKIFI